YNGAFLVTLNAGESFATYIGGPSAYIEASAPVSVLQASGYGCEVGLDVIPPIVCTGSSEISFTRSTTESLSANLLVQSGSEGDFLFNGNNGVITAGMFSPVPGTSGNWLFAQVSFDLSQTPLGTASLITNTTGYFHMGFIHGSFSSGCRFGYFSNFSNLEVEAQVADDEVCQGETLALSCSSINGGSYSWTGPGGFSSSLQSPTLSSANPAMSGDYIVMVSAAACDSDYDTLAVIVHPVFQVQQDTSFCAGDLHTLPDGVVVNLPGNYQSVVQSSLGCDSIITTLLSYYPTEYTISPDTAICKGTAAELRITGGDTYLWSAAPDLSSTSIANPTVSPNASAIYTVEITFDSGCTIQEDIAVSVYELPFTLQRVNPLCTTPGSLEVIATAGEFPYSYSIGGTSQPNSLFDDLSAGTFLVEVIDANQCTGDSLITLTLESYEPAFKAVVEPMVCETPGSILVVPGANGSNPFEVVINGQPQSGLFIADVATGSYTLELSDANGCSSLTSVEVEQLSPAALIIDAYPVVGRPPLSVDFENNSIQLQDFVWNFGDGVVSTEFEPSHVFELSGSYQVQVFGTDTVNGCTDVQLFTVLVRPPFSIYVPNAFSPNGDNVNDVFIPQGDGFDIASYSLAIFNRWGDLVFESTNPNQPWTGNVNGSNHFAADGVYFWILRIKPDLTAEMLEYEGAVNLFR
ncbi:MAG: gliding motility-associated C-terminal domain-containing protein, partial [Flavobacteriales bacterium]